MIRSSSLGPGQVALGGGAGVGYSPEALWEGWGGVLGKPPSRKIIEPVLMSRVSVRISRSSSSETICVSQHTHTHTHTHVLQSTPKFPGGRRARH